MAANCASCAANLDREKVLNIALAMGKVLLISGAETYRVEETIVRFCRANGYNEINVFVTPTVIIIGDESSTNATMVCRIMSRSTNLSLVSEVMDFSFKLKQWNGDYESTMAYFEGMLRKPVPFGKWPAIFASAVGAATFAVMLGGNFQDFIAALITGGVSMWLSYLIAGYRPSAFWANALAGVAIGFLAIACCLVIPECTRSNIIVGGLMPFLPGVAFVNGLRDYMAGDLISGNCRIAEAMLLSTALAIGLAFALLIWYNWGWTLWY